MAKLPSGRIGRVLSLSDLRQTEGLGRRLRRPALSFGDQAFCSICNFLTTVLLARMLGLEGFGLYAMIWLPIYLAMSLQLGLIVSPMMSIGGKLSKGEAEPYFGTVLLHELAFLAVIAIAIGCVAAALSLSDLRFSGTILPAAAMAAAYLAQDFLRRLLFVRGRPGSALAIDLINQGGKIGALMLLGRWWSADLEGVLWIVAGAAAASTLLGLALAGPITWRPRGFGETTARQWRSARWLVLTGSVQWILGYSGMIVAGGLLGAKTLGALRAVQSLIAVLNVVREALENVVPPLAGRSLAQDGLEGLTQTIGLCLLGAAAAGAATFAGLALFGPWLLHLLYGAGIADYSGVIVWYGLVFPLALVNLVLGCLFRALERTRSLFMASLLAACLNLAIVYPMTAGFGIYGIAAVSLISEVVVLMVLSRAAWRVVKGDRPALRSPEPATA